MIQNDLKHLRRTDLLEMLLEQCRENEELHTQIDLLCAQQNKQEIMLNKAGSIAEAALMLNGVFEAAQKACDQYILNIEHLYAHQQQICTTMEQETNIRCQQMLQDTREECERMLEKARRQSDAYWHDVFDKMRDHNDSNSALRALVASKSYLIDNEH